ncbi:hypothetical protein GJ688_00885 [Heliobacillus mobilis]|uniref:Uncharacterized protein n=1 Tax=Heliobacterium mobile TaxID=28064 RepID=A0A6I3SB89_HELMO|nr:hypothetical protein [Heliobacterium mobile]MTV47532.1 hypothetical protein [Heliobacterium mobile]
MDPIPSASSGYEYLITVLSVLVMSTVELFKYFLQKETVTFKVIQPFILVFSGFFWGSLYGLWRGDGLTWTAIKEGAELGVYVSCVSGTTYGIFKSLRQVRDKGTNE